jgi:putative membrane-bound dehydrogenase-like protein
MISMRPFVLFFAALAMAADPVKAPIVPTDLPPEIQILQPGVKLTLLVEHPDLATPTGLDVDAKGNLWTVSCHTHFRPAGYVGPIHDEVLVFDRYGKNRRVFYAKTDQTMNLKLGKDGWVYLSQRNRILRIKDTDGDGIADKEENVATLTTVTDYPHNGLSGMAWAPSGDLVFSLGENFGKDWVLAGPDGIKLTGRGEGGVFTCQPDGAKLRRIAKGFWNPFGIMVRADGEIFAVDNDPGSRPPCRLLRIHEGADYGFQWVYGREPIHPFVAWNGELRGTLGMIHPSGEGPCSVVELGGGVLIPSWSNHCVEYFPLTRAGADYTAKQIPLVRGGEFLRPTCLAVGQDGTFYFNDWVFSSYPIHGKGRLWKLEIDRTNATWLKASAEAPNAASLLAEALRSGQKSLPAAELLGLARGSDRVLADAALAAIARAWSKRVPAELRALSDDERLLTLVALRRLDLADDRWLQACLKDESTEIRFECLRWIADGVLKQHMSYVEATLRRKDIDFRVFEAALAARNTLLGKPEAGVTDAEMLSNYVSDKTIAPRLRSYALRLMPETSKFLTVRMMSELIAIGDADLSREAVRNAIARRSPESRALLALVAADEKAEPSLRGDAIAGMSVSDRPEHLALLRKLTAHTDQTVRHEALRALRYSALDDADKRLLHDVRLKYPDSDTLVEVLLDASKLAIGRPAFTDTLAWLQRLDALPGRPDLEVARRLFTHPKLSLCASCHRHEGRGNVVGPDLTLISRQADRAGILQSILEPNREVAPQYFPTQLGLADGTTFVGILLRSSEVETYREITGKEKTFRKKEILSHEELKISLMPPGLALTLTDTELRDLLALLTKEQ